MIAGGASWPHWLARHGDRRQALARRRLRVRRRGRRAHAGAGVDRPRPPRLPRRLAASTATRTWKRRSRSSNATMTSSRCALAYSFYAEQPAALGDIDEARRRRLVADRLPHGVAAGPVRRSPSESYSRAKLGAPRRRPRRGRAALPSRDGRLRPVRPAGHELDVPRHGRRLRRARRRLPGRDQGVGGRHRDQRRRCSGASPGRCSPRLGWVLLQDGESARAEAAYQQRARLRAAGCSTRTVIFLALTGLAALHRIHGRNDATRSPRPTEALEIYRAGGPRRFRNRVDTEADLRGRRRGVLRGARGDRRGRRRPGAGGDAARAGRAPARRGRRRGPGVPARRRRTGSRRRRSRRLRRGRVRRRRSSGRSRPESTRRPVPGSQPREARTSAPARRQVSALLDGGVVPQAAGPTPGGPRECIPVPPRPQQRPAPVHRDRRLADGRRRHRRAARRAPAASSTTASASPASSRSTPPTS